MGDSDFLTVFSILALAVIVFAIMAFIFAGFNSRRSTRTIIGILLMFIAAFSFILSFVASLLIGILGVVTLILAVNTRVK